MENAFIQFLPFVFWVVVAIIPSVKLLQRIGMHPALNLIPVLGTVVILWVVAYSRWPKTQGQ
jgi:hypothetical protein